MTRTPRRQKTPLMINGSNFSNVTKCKRCKPNSVNEVNVIIPVTVAIASTVLSKPKPTQPYFAPVKKTGKNASHGENVSSASNPIIAAQSDLRCDQLRSRASASFSWVSSTNECGLSEWPCSCV